MFALIFLSLIIGNEAEGIFSNEFLLKNIQSSLTKYQSKPYGTRYAPDFSQNSQSQTPTKFGLYKLPNSDKYGFYGPGNNLLSNEIHPGNLNVANQETLRPGNHQYGLIPQQQQNVQDLGVVGALDSIASHDTLQCIPKLLCDFVVENRRPQSSSSIIPNIDMSSILSYLDVIGQGSPVKTFYTFGKAAVLGYSANGDSYKCTRAYPTCPRNPDQLIEYLNNHNGGFFRYFNGLPKRHDYNNQNFNNIQKRIQNQPSNHFIQKYQPQQAYPSTGNPEYIYENGKFTLSSSNYQQANLGTQNLNYYGGYGNNGYIYQNGIFPTGSNYQGYSPNQNNLGTSKNEEYIYQNGKFIPLNKQNKGYKFDYAKPSPGVAQVGVAFPDRTGTGELLLDDKFNFNSLYSQIKFPN